MSQDGRGDTPNDAGARRPEQVGSLSEETAKLLGALSDWAKDHGTDLGEGVAGLAGHAARSAQDVSEHLATGAAECTYCPICRTVHVLRETTPEVRAQLVTAANALLQAASGLLASAVPERPDPSAGVERIDLDEDPDGDWPDEPDSPEEGDR